MLGYRLWTKDRMAVDEFECLNCDEENVFGAHAMDDETEIEASDYSLYGDFMYYFDEHLFDFANDEDWKSNNGDLSKCSVAIPGLHHKVCVDHDNDKYQIRFGAASDTARRRLRNHGYGDEYNDYLDSQQEMHDLGNILLDWEDNTDWNEISDVSDHNDALGDTQHSIRKCKTQQSVQICGTMRDNNMKVSVKVGRHKYHRSSAHQEMKNAQFDYDLKLDNAAANTVQDMHWMVDHNVMNIDDKQWNDPRQFRTSHHYTYHKHHIMRRCKGTFCLCQYVDNAMDNVIHPCKPAFKADTNSIFGPKHLVNLADVMDSFVAPVHILRVMQPIRPITHRLPYVHILMLKANEHTKHKPLIQWHRYKPFARYIPPSKPQWLPPWMWYAVKQNLQPSGHNSILSSFITDQSVQSTRRRLGHKKSTTRKRAKSHGPRTRPKPKAKPKATPNAKPQAASVAAKPKAKPKAAPPKTKTKTETKAVGKPVSSGTKAETKAAPPAAPKAGEPVASTKEKAAGLLSRAQGLSDQHGGLAGMADTFNQVASVAKTAGIEVPTTDDMAATIADKATAAVAQHTGLDPTQVQALGNVASTVGEQVARQQMAAAPPESSTASEPAPPVTPSVPDAGSTASPQTPQTPVTPPAKTALATPVTPPVTGQVTGSNPALMTAVGTTGVQSPPAVLSTPPTTPVTAATPMMPLGSAPLPATQALPPVTPRYGLPPVSPIGTESRTAIGLLVAHVPMPQGFQSSQPPLMRAHTMVNNYHQYYDYEDDIDDQILDGWYDQYDENEWVVMDDADNGDVVDTLDLLDFEDDSIWDEIMMNIETLKGRPLAKKCMNLFGRTLCICEFMDWLNGKIIGGNTKHICYSSAHKESAITKKTMKQIQTVAKQKRKAKESKALKQEVVLGKALQKEQKEVQSLKKKETETKEQNKDLKKKEVHLKKEIQAKQKKENKAKEQNKELKKKEQHLKKEIETKKQKEVKAKEQNKDLKKKEQHLKKEIQTEKHKETKAKKETKQLKKKEDDLKKTLKKKIVQQKKKETVLEKELQKKVVQQKTSVHKKQVIEKNIVLKKTEKPVSPKHKALQKERDDLKKEIAKTVQEHSELKQKNKKIAVNTLRLNRMAQTKVTKGHQHIMKEHHVLMKQMKQLHHLMKKVRSQKNAALPHRRPIWLPHYFWHWLHHFPHFHELHLRHKMPWISSAAHIDEDEEHAFNGGMEMDDNDYAYGSEYDDAYDEWVEAAENYAKAYLEYNAALAGYDEDDAFVKAAENYAQAYLEYDDALDGFAYNGEDYDVDEMVEYILSGKEENEDYYYDDANDDDEMGTENEYVYEEEDDQYEEEQNEYAYDDDKALTYDDDTDETYGYDDLYNDEYEQYTDEGDHNYDEDSEYASNMDDYYVGEDGMSAWTMDDNDYHNDVNEEYDEFEYEYESHSDYSDAEDEESDEDGDALIAALAQSANDGTNPYWVFELIFLALCGFGVICAVIYVQKQEWIETIREMNRQRINSRKYGFNRINVVFDTEDTGSDDSDWGHHVPIANKMMDMDHDLSGDEHLGSSHESPINESEIHNMIQ
eukprot:147054_1